MFVVVLSFHDYFPLDTSSFQENMEVLNDYTLSL